MEGIDTSHSTIPRNEDILLIFYYRKCVGRGLKGLDHLLFYMPAKWSAKQGAKTSTRRKSSRKHAFSDAVKQLQLADQTETEKEFKCTKCHHIAPTHSSLHIHLIEKHSTNVTTATNKCYVCGEDGLEISQRHYCKLCSNHFEDLEDHEIQHYRDKIGDDMRFECPNCYKTYSTIAEMKAHNEAMHSPSRVYSHQRCFVCSKLFLGRNVRDQHIITHFKSICDGIMDNVEEIHRQMGDRLMSNQCPLCRYVMSTRKSFRHHLIFQHVLRDKGALNILLGPKAAKSDECSLVRLLLASPELLWKRGPLRTQSFPILNPINEISKPKVKKVKQEKMELPDPVDEIIGVNALPSISSSLVVKSQVSEEQSSGREVKVEAECVTDIQSADEPSWMKLKNRLSERCLERRDDMPDATKNSFSKFRCKICGEIYDRQFSFEVHLAEKHLNIILEE